MSKPIHFRTQQEWEAFENNGRLPADVLPSKDGVLRRIISRVFKLG